MCGGGVICSDTHLNYGAVHIVRTIECFTHGGLRSLFHFPGKQTVTPDSHPRHHTNYATRALTLRNNACVLPGFAFTSVSLIKKYRFRAGWGENVKGCHEQRKLLSENSAMFCRMKALSAWKKKQKDCMVSFFFLFLFCLEGCAYQKCLI